MILLNDILNLPSPRNVRLRFNVSFGTNRPAIDYFTDNTVASTKHMLEGMYWNYDKKSNFSVGNITLGFLKMPSKDDCWLLFHVGRVTKDLGVRNGVGYEYEELTENTSVYEYMRIESLYVAMVQEALGTIVEEIDIDIT